MKDRIAQILKTKNITATQFADELNVQRSGISHILSGRNNPSLDFVMKIKETYPEFNLEWLILGKGPATGGLAVKEVKPTFVPDLFAQPETKEIITPIIEEKTVITKVEDEELAPYFTTHKKAPSNHEEASHFSKSKKVIRLITLYDDNTFEAYEPSIT